MTKRKEMVAAAAIGLMLWAACGAAQAQPVYKWVDENGKTHYGSQPPPAKPDAAPLKLQGSNGTSGGAGGAAGVAACGAGTGERVANTIAPMTIAISASSPSLIRMVRGALLAVPPALASCTEDSGR